MGGIPQWFTSYQINRYQYVSDNHAISVMKQITCGIPQGLILGSLLVLSYINDIDEMIYFSSFISRWHYFILQMKKIQELSTIVNNELSNMIEWLNADYPFMLIKQIS